MVRVVPMSDVERRRSGSGARCVRFLVALLLVPTLLFGPLVGGRTVWLHAHDGHSSHVHVADSAHDAAALASQHDAWHAAAHSHDDDDEHDRGPEPEGVFVPRLVALPTLHGAQAPVADLWTTATATARTVAQRIAFAAPPRKRTPFASTSPPRVRADSGVVALLRASHALLI
jgi:hypothetical protein